MTLTELKRLLDATGFPVAYSHFKEVKKTPYITYLVTYSSNFIADNKVHKKIQNVDVELYVDAKDPTIEKVVEDLLDENELPYEKVEFYIKEENIFQIIYEVRLF